ncbi:MAG: immunoglobulin domain-containing protein, partial [Planctomycetota bacterium]|nr:immunoglobulin domain-containing protein [Planctomycetota bacterium]
GDTSIAASSDSQNSVAAALGGSVYLVVWSDTRARSGTSQAIQSDNDIFGVLVGADGQPLGEPFVIAGDYGNQQSPMVAWNGQSWLVVYQSQDPVGGYFETQLRAKRISGTGEVLDAQARVLGAPGTGFAVAGSSGQWLITQQIYHADGYGTYLAGQRLNNAGQWIDASPIMLIDWVYGPVRVLGRAGGYLAAGPEWNDASLTRARVIPLSGVPTAAAFNAPGMNIATDGTAFYVTWIANFTDLVGSRMSITGVLANPAGTPLFSDPGIQYYSTSLAHDGTNWWVRWGAASDHFVRRVNAAGIVLDPAGVRLPITITGTNNNAYNMQLHAAPAAQGGGIRAFWDDSRAELGSDSNAFSIGCSASNVPGTGVCASTSTRLQRSPELILGDEGVRTLVYVSEAANDDRVMFQRVSESGIPIDASPVEIHRGVTIGRVGIAWNGSVYMVVWDEGLAGLTATQVKARRVAADGTFIDATPISVMTGSNPAIGALGDQFLIVAPRFNQSIGTMNLMGSRLSGTTGTTTDGTGVIVATGFVTSLARVRNDGTQWLVGGHAMWSSISSQGDVFLAKVPASGPPLAAVNPTPVSGGTGDLDVAYSGSNSLLVWRSGTLSGADNSISGRIMNLDGTYGPTFSVAQAAGRQLRPTVSWDGTTYVVAWEDQRSQQAFFDARTDVYAARVDQNGTLLDPAGFAVQASAGGDITPSLVSEAGVTLIATARFNPAAAYSGYRIGLSRLGAPTCLTPQISSSPQAQTTCAGQPLTLTLAATGTDPLQFQWYLDNVTIDAAANPTASTASLVLDAYAGERGSYTCTVSNGCGTATTQPAVVSICIGDFNCDGGVDGGDIESFFVIWETGDPAADVNRDGGVDGGDIERFFTRWEQGC